ncbi:hypothetical protein BD413DRAFT_277887 [Trametes elegans]|nr:hypothetical protein BD413DRAFT_277887 [Trametes elegans]
MDSNGDPDVLRVWTMLSEVSEQLSQNRSAAVNLHALADGVKGQAIHTQTGFVLRRFNLDKPKEVYEAELEKMNAAMSAENQTLLNDNRQLSTLIREYEQTLEKTMEKFRIHAHEVQQRELALMRQYESVLVERETEALDKSLTANNAQSESLVRISRLLRTVLRKLGGEDIQAYEAYTRAQSRVARSAAQSREASSTSTSVPEPSAASPETSNRESSGQDKGKQRDDGALEDEFLPPADIDRLLAEEEDPERRVAVAEWSLEREIELARLERENEELRALVNGLLRPDTPASRPVAAAAASANNASANLPEPGPTPYEQPNGTSEDRAPEQPNYGALPRQQRWSAPPQTTVGPFGTHRAPPSSRYG